MQVTTDPHLTVAHRPIRTIPPEQIDAQRYPQLYAYLRRLPNSYRSHPQCTIVSDIGCDLQREHADLWSDKTLPAELRAALSRPWRRGEKVPTVLCNAQSYVIRDRLGLDEDAFLANMEERTMHMLRSPLYRSVLHVLSPNLLLMGTRVRWHLFNTGSELLSCGGDKYSHVLKLVAPAHVFDAAGMKFFASVFATMLSATRATRIESVSRWHSDTETFFHLKWY